MMKNQKLSWQGIDLIAVGAASARELSSRISGCEHCTDTVTHSVEGVLDDILARPNSVATYILGELLRCPACHRPLQERTLVGLKEWANDLSLKCFAPAF